MTTNKEHIVSIEKTFVSSTESILNLFKDNTVFKLTSADEIENDFQTGKTFSLIFNNRGTIHGRFIKITIDEIILEWNVNGFLRPPETGTIVEIKLRQENQFCILNLNHKNILIEESAKAKKKAWGQIIDGIEKYI